MRKQKKRQYREKLRTLVNKELEQQFAEFYYVHKTYRSRFRRQTEEQFIQYMEVRKRHYFRDDASELKRDVRRWCRCDWCISNMTYSSQKEINRIDNEGIDFFSQFTTDWD